MLQMPADVSRGGPTAEERPGESVSLESGLNWGEVGEGMEGLFRTTPLGQTSFPRRGLLPLSHLLLEDVRGDDAGPSGGKRQAGWMDVFPDPALTYSKTLYQRISDPPAFSYKQGQ